MPEWSQTPLLWIVAVAVALAIVFCVWRLIAWVSNINSDWKSFNRLTEKFPIELKELRQEVRDEFKEVRIEIKDVREDIKKLLTFLSPPAAGQSPVQLTDFGRTISKDASATEWAKEEAAGLVELSEGKKECEVFEMCIDFVSRRYAEDIDFKRLVKSTFYHRGTDSDSVLQVYQVELRDQILELLPE